MLLPRPPSHLLTNLLDAFITRSGGTEQNRRLAEIVAPHWNEIVDLLHQQGPGELRELRGSLEERLKQQDRQIEPLEMEAALLERLREAYECEARKHGETTRVADSVVLDQTPSEDQWWVWRAYSATTLILDCTEPDDVWESVGHPHAITKAYDLDQWEHMIERVILAQGDLLERINPMRARRDQIRFRRDLATEVLSDYENEGAVHRIEIELATEDAPQDKGLTPKEIEFVKTAFKVINDNRGVISRSDTCTEVDIRMRDKIVRNPDLLGGSGWGATAAKRIAIQLGVYVERHEQGRASRAEENQLLEVFQDGVRGLAEQLREAGVNIDDDEGNGAE